VVLVYDLAVYGRRNNDEASPLVKRYSRRGILQHHVSTHARRRVYGVLRHLYNPGIYHIPFHRKNKHKNIKMKTVYSLVNEKNGVAFLLIVDNDQAGIKEIKKRYKGYELGIVGKVKNVDFVMVGCRKQ
jgi:hypothetical protein